MGRCGTQSKWLVGALVLTASAVAFAARPPESRRPLRVAVTRVEGLGLSQGVVDNLQMLLRNSIATIPGFDVIGPVQVDMALRNPRNKAVAECGGGTECMVRVGKLVGADRLVFGTIGALRPRPRPGG